MGVHAPIAFFLCLLAALCAAEGQLWDHSKLNVHVVSHSHDDVGWLKTVDQYYAGLNNSIQHASVEMIITTVVESLLMNPDRKFIYVEIAYFARWWRQQNDDVKKTVRTLVKEGRLEFINGGWCMNDEATTLYTVRRLWLAFFSSAVSHNTGYYRPNDDWTRFPHEGVRRETDRGMAD